MDKKTRGAWLVHHSRKVQATTNQDFDAIGFAGKCGILLSALAGEDGQSQLTRRRVDRLAQANHLSPKTEVPAILQELERQRLINSNATHVEVLGLSGHRILEHTSTIFEESDREVFEDAVLDLSELASESPLTDRHASELLADMHKLSSQEVGDTLRLGTGIGFFDAEPISASEKLLFNGNLFRRDDAKRINGVLSTLKPNEARLVQELNAQLQSAGCLPLTSATKVLGEELFKSLHSIGMFDVNAVGNDSGKSFFVTRPAAFSKFSNSIADDALDLAKAFVASLTYGMTQSSYYRGRIQAISLLMNKLIRGGEVGPATAIGSDYQALEYRGVVQVTPADKGMFTMKLLKPEVGRLALAVIEDGDITAESVAQMPGARVTEYGTPEQTREVQRKNVTEAVKMNTANILNELRTGGFGK
ncbi:hypothetical protein DIE03_21145 [Burkholderia sp. Bp8992]|uniref:hypothetical protein n=1 Tax=Burkholderia sp. Bp8992 TaxID=2184554 RepID=UPI000F58DD11|nr:hypothetical protein [Burkholderia sp. Bp8992]RQS27529.1 hypothetical protein DIE03_21145 [Burkholderia sp. Bp8992]